jgi:ketosteroid isomerase-like protein
MGIALASLIGAAMFGSAPAAPVGASCNEQGSRELVARFITAFNRGDVRRLDAVFARGMWWRWYSVGTAPGKRIQRTAYNRTTLIKYFRARHKQHERLRLLSFQYNGRSDGYVHFQYELLRSADDMRAPLPRTYVGKGAISCWAGRIAVWSMGEES